MRRSAAAAPSAVKPQRIGVASGGNNGTAQKYGSVKYNRVPSSLGREEVHESYSNPINFTAASPPCVSPENGAPSFMNGNNRHKTSDETGLTSSGSAPLVGSKTPPAQTMSTLEAPFANVVSNVPRRHQLVLSPPSLHISFDVEPENNRTLHAVTGLPLSQSSDNVRHYHQRYGSVGSGSSGPTCSPAHLRRSAAYRHQQRRFFEQSEIAQISAGYMRVNGAIQQFRGILSAPEKEKSSTLLTKVLQKQHSKDKDREAIFKDKEESSCSTSLIPFSCSNRNHNNNSASVVVSSLEEATKCATSIEGENYVKLINTGGGGGLAASPSASCNNTKDMGANGNNLSTAESKDDAYKMSTCPIRRRQALFEQRRKSCDYAFGFAVLGIILMIAENEFTAAKIYEKSSPWSYALKTFIVITTIILLLLIIAYHALEMQLFMVDYGCNDWRILVNGRRIGRISIELFVCMICPIPGDFQFTWHTVHADGRTESSPLVPVDVLLSIPMFLRLYLLCRLMLLHSKLFTDAPSRSIGAMNRVNFTARFVLKTLMTMSPGTVLLAFTASFWIMAAWIMLLCERYHGYPYYAPNGAGAEANNTMHYDAIKHQNYLNSLWLVALTWLTIGYGDIVPNTICGRAVSVICGIMGAGTSSLVVAVVAKKLELSRAEKHVHNFMMDSMLTKKMKNAAANVLRETWLIYKNRKLVDKVDFSKIRYHQRRFLLAIYELRKVKRGQRKLNENSTTVADMAKTTTMMYEMIADMRTWQQEMEDKLLSMEQRCANVEAYMRQLQISIRVLPELVARKLQSHSFQFNKQSSQATSLGESHPPSAAQSTDAHPGSGFSTPE